jgi:hypothetical protein
MAAFVPELIAAGVTMIGGCCGTTPAHVAAFRAAPAGWEDERGGSHRDSHPSQTGDEDD